MGLDTDFNQSPYFDDFDDQKNFHKILFKPSFAVQARELTQLQTILQNQVERFGENILTEGTIVKGGNFVEENPLSYVKIRDNNTSNQSIVVSRYEGLYAVGTVTGLRALIIKTDSGLETQSPNLNTLFVKYLDNNDADSKVFNSNENLQLLDDDNNIIDTVTVAGTADPNPIGNGYGVLCDTGIIFHKGHFIRFENNLTVVSKYTDNPDGVVVGFETIEQIVNSDEDPSLLDNAEGFNNFNAPGADRLKLTPVLVTKTLSEAREDETFFAIQEYQNGSVVRRRLSTQYNLLEKMVEKRTVEKDGDVVIKRFPLSIRNSRNDAEVLSCVIGPGIAYVQGKRTELIDNFSIDFEKATDTDAVRNQDIVANYGHYITVENYTGVFDFNTFAEIDLLDSISAVIGTANIRSVTRGVGNTFRLYIFNIRMNATKTFANVRGVAYTPGDASADVILDAANNAIISDFSFKRALFEVGKQNIQAFDLEDTDYIYRTSNTNLEATTGGIIDINIPAGDTWQFSVGSTLNEDQKRELILIANTTSAPYTAGNVIDISGNNAIVTVATQTQLTITLATPPAAAIDVTGYYNAKRQVTSVNNKSLETIYIKIDTSTNSANTSGVYSLGVPDVLSIEGIWKVSGNTDYSETASDVTNNFRLFSNQKDTHYDLSYIAAVRGVTVETEDKFLVKAKVFRKTNSQNSFFTIDSYPIDDTTDILPVNKIRTEQIPIFASESGAVYNLRNVIDLRPYAANTAVYSTNISGATENPQETLSFGTASLNFAAPNRSVETSYSYYLGRIDRLIIDENSRFEIIKGISAENPVVPQEPSKSMTLAFIYVNPFPSLPIGDANRIDRSEYSVFIARVNNRNYTSRDVEKLERRIRNLEVYTSLTLLEKSATELTIKDADGLDRFKSGILVDNFENLSIANVKSNEFSASIDPAYKEIAPKFRSYPLDLKLMDIANVVDYGEVATLAKADVLTIEQYEATNVKSCTTNFWNFNGSMILFPDSDSTTDVTRAPDINFSVDLATPFTQFTTVLNEIVPLQSIASNVIDRNVTSSQRVTGSDIITSTTTRTTIENTVREISIGSSTEEQTLGDFVTNTNFNPFMRSRELQVQVYGLRPNTRFYFFFDQVNVNAHVAPGRLENGFVVRTGTFSNENVIKSGADGSLFAIFRIPPETFFVGDRRLEIFDVPLYSDSGAASSSAERTYHGFNISTTNAFLTTTTRMPEPQIITTISRSTTVDTSESIRRIPEPPAPPSPPAPPPAPGVPPPPPPPPPAPAPRRRRRWRFDPLAQTFIIDPEQSDDTSVFVTKLDLFFARKSETNGCIVEIREVTNGYPNGISVPFSRIHLTPDDITASTVTAVNATTVVFPAPVALKTGLEYAIVIQPDANDPEYQVWISRVGQTDVDTGLSVTQDSNAGMIFTSTNNKTWTPFQDENLKFNLYTASFITESGTLSLTNTDNEFLKLQDVTSSRFAEGEYVYVSSNTYLTGSISVESGNTTLVGVGTLFSSEYEVGEYIILDNQIDNIQVARIASIANNTVLTTSDVPFETFTASHYKSVVGKVSYYNPSDPVLLILDNSSAKDGLLFADGQRLIGVDSGAEGTISDVSNIPVSHLQANIFRSNFTRTNTSARAIRLFDGITNYQQNIEFNDNTYLNSRTTFVKSRSNELAEDLGVKSFVIRVNLNTLARETSPLVDHKLSNVLLYEHIINNDSSGERSVDGDAVSKYISRKVELADGLDAEDIRVFLTAYRPPGTDVEVWVKFQSASDSNVFEDCRCVAWTKLRKKDESNVFSSGANRFDFREIEYVLSDQPQEQGGGAWLEDELTFTYIDPDGAVYNNYKFFAVKIVFLSTSHNVIPRVRDMRAIAVS